MDFGTRRSNGGKALGPIFPAFRWIVSRLDAVDEQSGRQNAVNVSIHTYDAKKRSE
jgi:hypothetical protein